MSKGSLRGSAMLSIEEQNRQLQAKIARSKNITEVDHENQLNLEDLYKIRASSKGYTLKSDISQLRQHSKVLKELDKLRAASPQNNGRGADRTGSTILQRSP